MTEITLPVSIFFAITFLAIMSPFLGASLFIMRRRRRQIVVERTRQLEQQTQALAQAKEAAETARTEAEMQREKAEMANQSKSHFLANVSHELRTPLNAVMGYAQVLLRDSDLTEQQRERLSIIQESGQHLLTLIDDILDLSKIEASHMELYPITIQLPYFLQEVARIIEMRARQKDVAFSYVISPTLPDGVMADEKRLRQVLINLLDNAVKFTERGEIQFQVEGTALASTHYQICFKVTDTGVGIPPESLERIFRPFEQAGGLRQRTQGTGLGLSISQRLVRLMGGVLYVESEIEQGTTFWFELTLPVADLSGRCHRMRDNVRVTGYVGPRRRALVVDDNPINRRLLQDMLLDLGFAVDGAEGGETAVKKAEETLPDVVFMDLVMPGMNGFDAVRQLRQMTELADTLIIAVSASAFTADRRRSLQAGCNDFLAKPVTVHALQHCLQTHLQLEWIYATDLTEKTARVSPQLILTQTQNGTFTVPKRSEMEILLDLARRGDMRGVQEWAKRIREANVAHAPFARRLIDLAQGYEEQTILSLVRQYLSSQT